MISGNGLLVTQVEIDTEVVDLLVKNAAEDAQLTFSRTLPIGVK